MSRVHFIERDIDKTYSLFDKNMANMSNASLSQNVIENQLIRNKKQSLAREAKLKEYSKMLNGTKEMIDQEYSAMENKKVEIDNKINEEEYKLNMNHLNLIEKETYINSKNKVLDAKIENVKKQVNELTNVDIEIAKQMKCVKRIIKENSKEIDTTVFKEYNKLENKYQYTQEKIRKTMRKVLKLEDEKLDLIKAETRIQAKKIRIMEKQKQEKLKENANQCSEQKEVKNNQEINKKEIKKQIKHQKILNGLKMKELIEKEEEYQLVKSKIDSVFTRITNNIESVKKTSFEALKLKKRTKSIKERDFASIVMEFFSNREELKLIREKLVTPNSESLERELDDIEDELEEEERKRMEIKKIKEKFVNDYKEDFIRIKMQKEEMKEELKEIEEKIRELNRENNEIESKRIQLRLYFPPDEQKEVKPKRESHKTIKELRKEVETETISMKEVKRKEKKLIKRIKEEKLIISALSKAPLSKLIKEKEESIKEKTERIIKKKEEVLTIENERVASLEKIIDSELNRMNSTTNKEKMKDSLIIWSKILDMKLSEQ